MTDSSPASPGPDSPGAASTGSAAPGAASSGDVPPSSPTSPPGGEDDRLLLAAELGSLRASQRRRRLIIAGVAGTVVLAVLVCAILGTLATGAIRLVRNVDEANDRRAQVETACLALERRLNRLTPPGAARGPKERAAAIRNENTAVRPFLAELEAIRDRSGPGGRGAWEDLWRELLDARASYADALDRQAAKGEPAFFVAPRDDAGRSVVTRLEGGPESCRGVVRRLAVPDL